MLSSHLFHLVSALLSETCGSDMTVIGPCMSCLEEAQPGGLVFSFSCSSPHVGTYIGKRRTTNVRGRGYPARVSPMNG